MNRTICLAPAALLLLACASAPGPAPAPLVPAWTVDVRSDPPGARIARGDEALGVAPLRVGAASMVEALALRAESSGLPLVERRIRVRGEADLEITFRFGDAPTPLAHALGLGRVTVFDYAGGALFEVDRAELRGEALVLLARQAELLQGPFAGLRVWACGHTDHTGGEAHNLALSLARAEAVADVLKRHGVDASRIAVEGFGWQFPVAEESSDSGRALNRRAEIVLPDE